MLADLNSEKSVVLFYSNSSLAYDYVYDKLRHRAKATRDTVFSVKTAKQFDEMMEMVVYPPMQGEKWVFQVDLTRLDSKFRKVLKNLVGVETAYIIAKAKNWDQFSKLSGTAGVVDLPLSYMNADNVSFLLSRYVSHDDIYFIARNYPTDTVFEIFMYALRVCVNGKKSLTRKEIIGEFGSGVSSARDLVFNLVKDFKGSERSQKTQIKNRLKELNSLIEINGVRRTYNTLLREITNFMIIQELYLTGVIYKSLKQIPPGTGYNEDLLHSLGKYQYSLQRILDINFNRLVFLHVEITENRWTSKADVLEFVYRYYNKRTDLKEKIRGRQ